MDERFHDEASQQPAPAGEGAATPTNDELPTAPLALPDAGIAAGDQTAFMAPLSRTAVAVAPTWTREPDAAPRGRQPLAAALAAPWPRGLAFALGAGVVLALGLAVLVQELLLRGDWASGAVALGIAALAFGAGALLSTLVRYLAGRRVGRMVALGLVSALLLGTLGTSSLLAANSLHLRQGQTYERAKQWESALRQYALYGEVAPNAPNTARIYTLWGEELLAQRQYAAALDRFGVVTQDYARSGPIVARAATGATTAYAAWVQSGQTDIPFGAAITAFATARAESSCTSSCQSTLNASEAKARLAYGQALLGKQQYLDSIAQFEIVATQFAKSTEAPTAHASAAKAYLAYGKQQRAGAVCTDAIATYTTLAEKYGDTAEGKQARDDLNAPQDVTGVFTGYPTNPLPSVRLSLRANPAGFSYSDEYKTGLDGATGRFTFTGVAQGKYNLSTARDLYTSVEYSSYASKTDGNLYTVRVGPLCATNLGTIAFGK